MYINWIVIDTYIIIFLFLLLLYVESYKRTNRWRARPLNQRDMKSANFYNGAIWVESPFLLEKSSFSKKTTPVIFLSERRKLRFLENIGEGLSVMGHDIIYIYYNYQRLKEENIDLLSFLQNLFVNCPNSKHNVMNVEKLIQAGNFFLIIHEANGSILNYLLNSDKISKIILLNPKLNSLELKEILNTRLNIIDKFHLIFSQNSFFLLKNKYLSKFLETGNKIPQEVKIEQFKTTHDFKHVETLLLSKLSEIISKRERK